MPNTSTISLLADALNCSPDDLLEEKIDEMELLTNRTGRYQEQAINLLNKLPEHIQEQAVDYLCFLVDRHGN